MFKFLFIFLLVIFVSILTSFLLFTICYSVSFQSLQHQQTNIKNNTELKVQISLLNIIKELPLYIRKNNISDSDLHYIRRCELRAGKDLIQANKSDRSINILKAEANISIIKAILTKNSFNIFK